MGSQNYLCQKSKAQLSVDFNEWNTIISSHDFPSIPICISEIRGIKLDGKHQHLQLGPLSGRVDRISLAVFPLVGHIPKIVADFSNNLVWLRCEWIIRIWCWQQRLNREQHGADLQSRWPFVWKTLLLFTP